MDLELAEVRESIAIVLEEQCTSLAIHAYVDGHNRLNAELQRQAAELGWLAIALPEEQGGIGLGAAGMAILHLELGRACAPGAFLATSVALEILARSPVADDEGVAKLIADVIGGTATLAVEARVGASLAGGSTWLLGEASAAAALIAGEGEDLVLVGIADDAIEQVSIWDETRSMISTDLSAAAPIITLVGMRPLFEGLFALALAADSAGAARGVLDRTVAYMKEREQFGRAIAAFQALKHRAADHAVHAIICEHLVWQAVENLEGNGPESRLWPLMAKANVTEKASKISTDCVQLHGGVGYTREYDPHLFLKRIRLNEAMLAANTALRDRADVALAEAVRNGADVLEVA